MSADRPPPPNSTQSQPQQNAAPASEGTPASTEYGSNQQPPVTGGGPTISVQSGFVGLPFLPGTVRVQSIPLEIRSLRTSAAPRPQNNNNNTVNAPSNDESDQASQPSAPPTQTGPPPSHAGVTMFTPVAQIGIVPPRSAPEAPPTAAAASSDSQQRSAPQEGAGNGQQQQPPGGGATYNFNNPNVEFFMEVTPEGITIDSLETTLVGSNQANDCKCLLVFVN